MNPVFESARIRFVEVTEQLIGDYLVMLNDYEGVGRFIGGRSPDSEPYTAEKERRWVQRKLTEKVPVFSMLERESGAFIGNIELMDASEGSAELGIAITAAQQDRGFGTEAVTALVRRAFDTLGLGRVWLRVDPANTRAIHVYEKCGFRAYCRTESGLWMERLREA